MLCASSIEMGDSPHTATRRPTLRSPLYMTTSGFCTLPRPSIERLERLVVSLEPTRHQSSLDDEIVDLGRVVGLVRQHGDLECALDPLLRRIDLVDHDLLALVVLDEIDETGPLRGEEA